MHYPPMVRKRIVELARCDGMPTAAIAAVFGVSPSGVRRVLQRARERGTHPALPRNPGREPLLTGELVARVRAAVAARPDATRQELKDALGLAVGPQTVGEWLRRLGLRLKKVGPGRRAEPAGRQGPPGRLACGAGRRRPADDRVRRRERGPHGHDPHTRGRAPRGERVVERVPAGRWTTTTVLAAVRAAGPLAAGPLAGAAAVAGATDTDVFVAWVEHGLAPALRPGETVVMDNLRPHEGPRVRALVEAAGCRLLYLPPYGPDLNPMENMWSKVKGLLRSAAARTADALGAAIDAALAAVTPSDCRGFFRHCGYNATRKAALL